MNLIILSLAVLFGIFVFALTHTGRREDRPREEEMRQIQQVTKQRLERRFEQDNALAGANHPSGLAVR